MAAGSQRQTLVAECPVCLETMALSVIVPCGHLCCHNCIRAWDEVVNACPLCREPWTAYYTAVASEYEYTKVPLREHAEKAPERVVSLHSRRRRVLAEHATPVGVTDGEHAPLLPLPERKPVPPGVFERKEADSLQKWLQRDVEAALQLPATDDSVVASVSDCARALHEFGSASDETFRRFSSWFPPAVASAMLRDLELLVGLNPRLKPAEFDSLVAYEFPPADSACCNSDEGVHAPGPRRKAERADRPCDASTHSDSPSAKRVCGEGGSSLLHSDPPTMEGD
jgi:hypothetical protein